MNIAILATDDLDVSKGMKLLLEKYADKNPTIHLAVLGEDNDFYQSVIRTCIDKNAKINAYFSSAEGLDHILKQADDITVTDNPIKEVLHHLSPGDAMGVIWDDSEEIHYAVHTVEDLALDTWDLVDGLTEVMDPECDDMDSNELHDIMMASLGQFVDAMCAFVSNAVMEALSQAVAEHIMDAENLNEINPFEEE